MILKTPKNDSLLEKQFKYSYPSNDEIYFVAKTQEECYYYLTGLDVCRNKTLEKQIKINPDVPTTDFTQCKDVYDAYYRCTTHEKFGRTLNESNEEVRPYLKNFASCIFKDNIHIGFCRKYFDDVLRSYFRQPDSPLKSVY